MNIFRTMNRTITAVKVLYLKKKSRRFAFVLLLTVVFVPTIDIHNLWIKIRKSQIKQFSLG
jgi:hypothetical protein